MPPAHMHVLNKTPSNPSALPCVYRHWTEISVLIAGKSHLEYLAWGLSLRSLAKALISLAIGASVFGQTYTIQTIAGGAFPLDGPARSAVFGLIGGLAVDSSGNLYIALHSSHMVVKVDASGNMTRVAGSGVYGFSGDGGPATSARLAYPQGLLFDTSGNLYIQDGGNQRVRMVSGGTITTVPGTAGLLGVTQGIYFGQTAGLNHLPGLASLGVVSGMAMDSKGALYISDTINHRVFKVSGGTASILAGTGQPGYSGDGGNPSSAQLNHPFGIAIDASDNIFIADTHNNRIREILASNGVIYTACGLPGVPYYSGDEGDAAAAAVNNPIGVTFDSAGNLYIADSANFVIRKVWKAAHHTTINGVDTALQPNTIETVAGVASTSTPMPRPNPVSDGASATAALLGVPTAVAADAAGNIYFTDLDHQRVMMMSPGGVLSTVAGGGTAIGDNGPAASAQLVLPFGVAADSNGNVYSLDKGLNGVRKISGGTISTVVGNGIFGGAGDYLPAASAQLAAVGIASDATGNLFFATSGNYLVPPNGGRIRELTGGTMFSVAGSGQVGSDGDGGPANNAQLNDPMGVAVDGAGNFYIADTNNFRIRMVSGASKTIGTLAGDGTNAYGGDNGAATSAQIGRPFRIAADSAGNVYIADFDNAVIRKVTASNGIITTIAGTGTAGYSGDGGAATSAQIDRPSALAVNAAGDLFFFDLGNNVIRKISNGTISTVAGNGVRGYSGDNGPALNAQLGRSFGLTVDASGKIYVADVDNNVLRVLTTGTVSCTYAVSPLAPPAVDASGANVTLTITTGATCAWSLTGLPEWITVIGTYLGFWHGACRSCGSGQRGRGAQCQPDCRRFRSNRQSIGRPVRLCAEPDGSVLPGRGWQRDVPDCRPFRMRLDGDRRAGLGDIQRRNRRYWLWDGFLSGSGQCRRLAPSHARRGRCDVCNRPKRQCGCGTGERRIAGSFRLGRRLDDDVHAGEYRRERGHGRTGLHRRYRQRRVTAAQPAADRPDRFGRLDDSAVDTCRRGAAHRERWALQPTGGDRRRSVVDDG